MSTAEDADALTEAVKIEGRRTIAIPLDPLPLGHRTHPATALCVLPRLWYTPF